MISGVLLVVFGCLWLLNNAAIVLVNQQGWALLAFLAAAVVGVLAARQWLGDGAQSGRAAAETGAATLLLLIGIVLWFDLKWTQWWPIFVIVPGIALLLPRHGTRTMASDN